MKRTGKLIMLLVVLALVAGLSGCGTVAKKAVEGATGVKVDEDAGVVQVEGEDGEKMTIGTKEGELPEGLPSDVPTYDGDSAEGGVFEVPEAKTFSFSIRTKDDVGTVADWYRSEFESRGWTIDAQGSVTANDAHIINATKGETLSMVATIAKDETTGETTIGCVVNEKK